MSELVLLVRADRQTQTTLAAHHNMGEGGLMSIESTELLLKELESPDSIVNAVILGTETDDPIQLAQKIHAVDREISLILQIPDHEWGEIEKKVRFTPFLGPNIRFVPRSGLDVLVTALREAVQVTHKSRQYKKLLEAAGPVSTSKQTYWDATMAPMILDRLLDHAPIGIALITDSGSISSFNRYAADTLAISERDALGKNLRTLFPEFEHSRLSEFVDREGDESGLLSSAPATFIRFKGSEKQYIEIKMSVLRERGLANGKLMIFQDVTSRIISEVHLRQKERHLRQLTEAMPQLAWTATPDGTANYANNRCIEYTGYDVTDKARSGWATALHPDDFDRVLTAWNQSVETRSIFEAEYRLKSVGGTYKWFLGRAVPLADPDGEVALWIGTATDIEDKKRVERLLKETKAVLEEEVEKRTIELRDANTVLMATNEELEAFCYSVSHDLRAPLRGIDGFSQALMEDYENILDATGKQYLQFVRDGIQNMGRLIDELLDLSRLTRTDLNRQKVDLAPVAHGIMGRLRSETPSREASFQCPEHVLVYGDPVLLEAALENLLANAWKFTSRRPVARIEFNAALRDGKLLCSVRDNGVGFNMNYYGKLFGAFQRLHSQKEFPGTGVGLATVRRIVLRHGGQIWAESDPNSGATFFFTLEPFESSN